MDEVERPLRVLVPLDGSARAEAALAQLRDLLTNLHIAGGVEVHLVCVLDPTELALAQVEENIAAEGTHVYLKRVAERMQAEYPQARLVATWSVMVQHDVADVLIKLAETGAANAETPTPASFDLVAMAKHGRTGLARWALGSITERIYSSIRVLLFIVRPTDIVQKQLPADVRDHVATAGPP